jgi:hypothetical protein
LSTRNAPGGRRAIRGLGVLVAVLALILGPGLVAQSAQASVRSLTNTARATISGVPAVGSVLTANPGGWAGAAPFFYTYYWSSPKSSSHLTDTQSYTPVASDLGQVLTVHITVQDNNNAHQIVTASTPAITASDVVNTVPPKFSGGLAVGETAKVDTGTFTSGSGALTYTYSWSSTDGKTSTPLKDVGDTHVITKADLGFYLEVVVTAKSPTQVGSATARTGGVMIPAEPFASDAGLTSSNRGDITGHTSKNTATISVPSGKEGNGVFVYGYSTATPLGWFTLNAKKQLTVSYLELAAGSHKLVVLDQTGSVVGWLAVKRAATVSPLASTANAPIAVAAVIVVLGIIVLIVATRVRARRKRGAPRH